MKTQELYARRPQPTPDEALERLLEGNRRFASNVRSVDSLVSHLRRAEFAAGQRPFAVILGCSDSRAPAEIVFDQGLGDLFVIRVAGPVVEPSQLGSVEFACAQFETPLVVVLGHTSCGAVSATIKDILAPEDDVTHHVFSIIAKIRPGVEELVHQHAHAPGAQLVDMAVKANVRACVRHVLQGSPLLRAKVDSGSLKIVGAEYHIEVGRVELVS